MNFLVIGAGIAGSSFARIARENGHRVVVAADNTKQRSSEAALCVVKPSWFKDEYRKEAEWSLAYYRRHGWITSEEAEYKSHLRDGLEIRKGYYGIDPIAPLVEPDIELDWSLEHPINGDYDHTVVCRGAYSDLNWKRLWGTTSVYRQAGPIISRAFNDRPRSVIFNCSHDGQTLRFGSSRAKTEREALEKQTDDERKAANAGFIPTRKPDFYVHGVRLMPPTLKDAGLIRSLTAKATAVEGFGRVGYSLAPARMNEVFVRIAR